MMLNMLTGVEARARKGLVEVEGLGSGFRV